MGSEMCIRDRPSGCQEARSTLPGVYRPKQDQDERSKLLHPYPNGQFFQIHGSKFKLHPLDTRARPLYSLCAVFGMSAQMAGGTVGTNLGITFIFPVSVPVGGMIG